MKRTILFAFLAVAAAYLGAAETPAQTDRWATKTLRRLTKKLDLTPDQQARARSILIPTDGAPAPCGLTPKQTRAIEETLTPDQRSMFLKMKEVKAAENRRYEACCPVP